MLSFLFQMISMNLKKTMNFHCYHDDSFVKETQNRHRSSVIHRENLIRLLNQHFVRLNFERDYRFAENGLVWLSLMEELARLKYL